MFHTFAPAEAPYPAALTQDGQKHWYFVEYSAFSPWFHVAYETGPKDGYNCMKVRCFMQLEHFIEFAQRDAVIIKELKIVTPKYVNGTDEWQMDPLREIWQVNCPINPEDKVHVYVLKGGKRYQEFTAKIPEENFRDKKIIFKLRNQRSNQNKQ